MPSLRLIVASGTAQRRLLEETVKEYEKKGYILTSRQEGGEWPSLLSDNMSGGLFDENRLVVVDGALQMGPMPKGLVSMIEKESSVVIVLVYDSDPSKLIPKEAMDKCTVLRPEEFPRWPRERQTWVINTAKNMKINIGRDAAAMIVELLEDPEEIRGTLLSLSMLKREGIITPIDVETMCLDDGSRNLLRLLDGICSGNTQDVMRSFRSISKNGELIPLVSALHNRMRLAWYASANPRNGAMFAKALGARDYAWKMACGASSLYGLKPLSAFITGLIKTNIDEKSGSGSGWQGLETLIIALLSSRTR